MGGFQAVGASQDGNLHTGSLGQVVNQAEIPHVAVELKGRVVTKAGIKDIAGKFVPTFQRDGLVKPFF